MSDEMITKDDLRNFGRNLLDEMRQILADGSANERQVELQTNWLKSAKVRKILDISPGSLQSLRVSGKIRFKKVLGSYYYSRVDLEELFKVEG